MTPEKQRIAIALLLGAHWVHVRQECWLTFDNLERQHGWYKCDEPRINDEILIASNVPDYPSDLNAMHEAEKVFNQTNSWKAYRDNLVTFCGGHACFAINATAAQRAETFLKTLNLWKD